jgi:hypothetical protein
MFFGSYQEQGFAVFLGCVRREPPPLSPPHEGEGDADAAGSANCQD